MWVELRRGLEAAAQCGCVVVLDVSVSGAWLCRVTHKGGTCPDDTHREKRTVFVHSELLDGTVERVESAKHNAHEPGL